ncbi:MAG: MFS transporter [Enterobacter hormaechei]
MLWIATVVSNVGSWMSDVGINWSMLTLSADPLDIALVQAASSLPMFLFALPSGVMADIVDRRKYLLFSQLWVFIAAAGLTLLSCTGHVTSTVLLAATFLLSVGAAMSSPPFQAIVPDLVSKPRLVPPWRLTRSGSISAGNWPALAVFCCPCGRGWCCPERAVRDGRGVGAVALASGTVRAAFATGALLLRCAPGSLRTPRRCWQRAGAHHGHVFGSAGWALLPLVRAAGWA